jgi:O-antigen/teichoic acid export membrane protein
MGKLWAIISVLRKGSEVADPEKWKSRTISTSMIVALLASCLSVSRAFGYEPPITAVDLENIAVGIIAIGGIAVSIVTAASSKRAGLPAKTDVPGVAEEPAAPSVAEITADQSRNGA